MGGRPDGGAWRCAAGRLSERAVSVAVSLGQALESAARPLLGVLSLAPGGRCPGG